MKKITLIILLLSSFLLVACGQSGSGDGSENTSGGGGSSAEINEDASVDVYLCKDEALEDCSAAPMSSNLLGSFKVTPTLCSVSEGPIDEENFDLDSVLKENYAYSKIVESDNDGSIGELTVEFRQEGTNTIEEKGRTIDLMFDLTYYDVGNKDIEKKVISNRLNSMIDYLEGKNSIEGLKKGDNVILRFIGTMDYGIYPSHKNDVLKDKLFYTYGAVEKEEVSNERQTIRLTCVTNKRTGKVTSLAYLGEKETVESDAGTNEETEGDGAAMVYEDKEEMLKDMTTEIASRYQKYSYGTYLIEALYNNTDFIALDEVEEDDVTLIFSDFRFQLHPKMKENRKDVIGTANWNFPPVTLSMWDEGTDYYKFYTNTVPQYLDDKCAKNQKLYLVGLELDDDLDRQIIMKQYYKDVLFKDCDVYFK